MSSDGSRQIFFLRYWVSPLEHPEGIPCLFDSSIFDIFGIGWSHQLRWYRSVFHNHWIGLSCFFWQESSICDGQSHEFPVDFPSGAPLRPSKDLPKLVRLWGTSKLASWVMSSWCHDTIFERCWVSHYHHILHTYIYIYIIYNCISTYHYKPVLTLNHW